MGLFRHMFRTMTKPYYVAVGETIADLVYDLISAVGRAGRDPARIGKPLKVFDIMIPIFLERSDRETLKIAVAHWAQRVGSPVSVETMVSLFSDNDWLNGCAEFLQRFDQRGGMGLGLLQQTMKDCELISGETVLERAKSPDSPLQMAVIAMTARFEGKLPGVPSGGLVKALATHIVIDAHKNGKFEGISYEGEMRDRAIRMADWLLKDHPDLLATMLMEISHGTHRASNGVQINDPSRAK